MTDPTSITYDLANSPFGEKTFDVKLEPLPASALIGKYNSSNFPDFTFPQSLFTAAVEVRAALIPKYFDVIADAVVYEESCISNELRCIDLFAEVPENTDFSIWAAEKVNPYLKNFYDDLKTSSLHSAVTLVSIVGIPEHNKYLVLRVYNNADFVCTEHPELLLGAPLGQYHCPICGHMQIAGMFHFLKDEVNVY